MGKSCPNHIYTSMHMSRAQQRPSSSQHSVPHAHCRSPASTFPCLQERGAARDAMKYSWHIATFFLGGVFAPACVLCHDDSTPRAPATEGESAVVGRRHLITVHALVLEVVTHSSAVSCHPLPAPHPSHLQQPTPPSPSSPPLPRPGAHPSHSQQPTPFFFATRLRPTLLHLPTGGPFYPTASVLLSHHPAPHPSAGCTPSRFRCRAGCAWSPP